MTEMVLFMTALLAGWGVWMVVGLLWPRLGALRAPMSSGPGTVTNIEGLRGYLAFSVFLHHAIITRHYLSTGKWEAPSFHASTLLGEGGVSLFFLITAFLFWSKVIKDEGKLNLRRFFKGRLLRLAPLYLGVTAVIITLSLAATGWRISAPMQTLSAVGHWLGLGLLGMPNINGVESRAYVASVFWSLQWEWSFYLALPFLALMLRLVPQGRRLSPWVLLSFFPLAFLHPGGNVARALLFVGGMLVAHLWADDRFQSWRPSVWALHLGCVVALGLTLLFPTAYGVPQATLFTVLFALILKLPHKAPAERVLSWFPARALGTLSYSVYVVHGLVLYGMRTLWPEGIGGSTLGFLLATFIGGLIVVHASLFSFFALEYPFFRKGRKSLRALIRRPAPV